MLREESRREIAFRHGPRFTFLEVLIAVAILGVSLAMVISIVGGARTRILRAERSWGRQHLLTQGVEMYLLGGPKATVPQGLLPPSFALQCELTQVDDLPAQAMDAQDGWVLGRYHISLIGRDGTVIDEATVEKLVREEDL